MANPFSFLKKFGLFSPGTVKNGGKISHPGMKNLYEELKKIGFRETRWQILNKEQLAGLVLLLTDGENELHIRFYKDRVFAECEAARIYISHLFKRAINANCFFLGIANKNLPEKTFALAEKMLRPELQSRKERLMEKWDYLKNPRPVSKAVKIEKTLLRPFSLPGLALSSWHRLAVLAVAALILKRIF